MITQNCLQMIKSRPEIKEDFKIVKTADKKEVIAGDTINYTITVENTGNNPIKGEASDGSVYKVTVTAGASGADCGADTGNPESGLGI